MLPEVRAALAGKNATVLRHNDAYSRFSPLEWVSKGTSIRLHQARPIMVAGKPVGVVLVSRSPAALFRGMWEDAGKIAVGTLTIFALLLLFTSVLARAIVRPVEKLSEAARSLASGGRAYPRRPTLEVREIRSLFDDFEAMAASIARRRSISAISLRSKSCADRKVRCSARTARRVQSTSRRAHRPSLTN